MIQLMQMTPRSRRTFSEADFPHARLTHRIIGIAFHIHNVLGGGFPEEVYKRAMARDFDRALIKFVREAPVPVHYVDEVLYDQRVDFLVERVVMVEVKAVEKTSPGNELQLVNYLKASPIEVGLLLNFGWDKVHVIRRAYSGPRCWKVRA